MKQYNKQILEAVNRGIKFALSDLEDSEELSSIAKLKIGQIESTKYSTRDIVDLKKEVVDLGLPSGTLWCKYNLGAIHEPNNNKSWFGDYYAWGELQPNKKPFDWDHYKFYDGPDTKAVKDTDIEYCISKYSDYLTNQEHPLKELLPEDDAAYQNKKLRNFKFRIPTNEQAQELLDNTKTIYVQDVSKNPEYKNAQGYTGSGWFMISKINGNYLFFPETGIKEGNGISLDKIESGIWTANIADSDDSSASSRSKCAWAIRLYPSFKQAIRLSNLFGFWKYKGLQIRPVIKL